MPIALEQRKNRFRVIAALSVGMIGLVCLAACAQIMGVEDPVLLDKEFDAQGGTDGSSDSTSSDGSSITLPDGRCIGAGCSCEVDSDCTDKAHSKCVEKQCVECTKYPDSCVSGQFCTGPLGSADAGAGGVDANVDAKADAANALDPASDPGPNVRLNVCAPGCNSDGACSAISGAAPFCNLPRHQCVACRADKDCANLGQGCTTDGRCVPRCDPGPQCPPSQTCCAHFCVDVTSDFANCNACGAKCTGGDTLCCAGACKNPLTASDSCSVCGKACSGLTSCSAGTCK